MITIAANPQHKASTKSASAILNLESVDMVAPTLPTRPATTSKQFHPSRAGKHALKVMMQLIRLA